MTIGCYQGDYSSWDNVELWILTESLCVIMVITVHVTTPFLPPLLHSEGSSDIVCLYWLCSFFSGIGRAFFYNANLVAVDLTGPFVGVILHNMPKLTILHSSDGLVLRNAFFGQTLSSFMKDS